MPLTRDDLQRLVELEAALQGVDPAMARAVAQQESGFDHSLVSPKGAIGVMQLMTRTAKDLGVNPHDPADNIMGGVKYLAQLSQRYEGDREKTLAAYNAGPGMVDQYKGVPPFKETKGYVSKILGLLGPASADAAPLSRLQELEAELARREQAAPASTPDEAAATIAQMRQRQAEPPSDLTVDIEKASPAGPAPTTMQAAIQGIAPLDETAASRMLAARSPLPSAGEQARTIGAVAVPAVTATGGAMAGTALGGPAGGVAGGIAGGVYGTRLSKQLGLLPEEEPLLETVVGPVYPSDALNVGIPLAARGLAPVVTKVGNAISGVTRPARQHLMDLANRYGIRLSYGDVSQGSGAPKVESFLESIPGSGAGRFRVNQQRQVRQAGEQLTGDLQTAMTTTPWRDLPTVQRVALHNTSQGKAARALLAEIDEAGDDWGRVIQASGKLNLFQDRLRAEQLYDRVDELARPLGNMRLPQTTRAIDAAVADVQGDVLPSAEVRREVGGLLSRVREAVSPSARAPQPSMGVRDPVTGTLRAQPMTESTNLPDTTYSRMRRLRSDLGDMQRTATEPTTARYLGQVKTALEQDMATFTQQSGVPALRRAHQQADQFYRTHIVGYREKALAKAIEKDLPDEIYGKFVRHGQDRAQYFYNGLDTKGQAAVRYGMVREATDAATSGALDVFSPAKFAQSLGRIQEASGVFFRGQPQWEINGFRRLMAHAQRAGQYAENPPTGNRGAAILVGTTVGNLASLGQFWAGTRALHALFMTRPGRNFLLAASDLQPGSGALTRRLDQFLRSPTMAPVVASGQAGGRALPEE